MRPSPESIAIRPLSSILGSESNVRILRCMVSRGAAMATGDLQRLTKLSRNGIWLALNELEKLGIVQKVGPNIHAYRIDDQHPLAPAMEHLFAAEREAWTQTVERLRSVALDCGLESLWLFGSVARGSDTAESDIDLLAIGTPSQVEHLREIMSGVRLQHEVSIVSFTREELETSLLVANPVAIAALTDAVVIHGRSPEMYRQIVVMAEDEKVCEGIVSAAE